MSGNVVPLTAANEGKPVLHVITLHAARSRMKDEMRRQNVWEQIQDQGFAYFNLGNGEAGISAQDFVAHRKTSADQFSELIKDAAESRKWQINIKRHERDGEPDVGYLPQRKGEKKKKPRPDEIAEGRLYHDSNKFTFHFHPDLWGYLAGQGADLIKYRDFMISQSILHGIGTDFALGFAEMFDDHYPDLQYMSMYDRYLAGAHEHVTRLLEYPYDEKVEGNEKAKFHTDQCGFSVHHISDFRGGLRGVSRQGKLVLPEEKEGHVVGLFPSIKTWAITRGEEIGFPHGVYERRKPASTLFPLEGDNATERRVRQLPRRVMVQFFHPQWTKEDIAYRDENKAFLKKKTAEYEQLFKNM